MQVENISLVAHDNKKQSLVKWVAANREKLSGHTLVYNVPTSCNRATVEFLISSPLLESRYMPDQADFSSYTARPLPCS